jgi:hypothetical protein
MKKNIWFLVAGIAACVAASSITVSDVPEQVPSFSHITIAEGRPAGCPAIDVRERQWREAAVRPSRHC